LGGGNHFIEINKDDDDNYYVTIHSGSRNLGLKVCNYHQQKINETKRFDYDEYHSEVKQIKRNFHDSKTQKLYIDELKTN